MNRARLIDWLVGELASRLDLDEEDVDVGVPFADFGLDSPEALSLTYDLGQLVGIELPETSLWDHPTISDLAADVASRVTGKSERLQDSIGGGSPR